MQTGKLQKKLNIQVKETNSRKVRVGHRCPSYPAHSPGPQTESSLCTETRGLSPSPVLGTQRLLYISGSLSTSQTSSPHHIHLRKVLPVAPFYFKSITEWIARTRRNTCSSNSQHPGHPNHDLICYSGAEMPTNQIHNPKSTNFRDWRKGQGKGIAHRDQTTQGQAQERCLWHPKKLFMG